MWIWTPFPWRIPQDPQPFPAPHRKCHVLCISIQTYFRAEKWKNWEKHSFPAISPTVAHISVGKWGIVPTVGNYQAENMKYLASSSPLYPPYFPAQTSWGEQSRNMTESLHYVILWLFSYWLGWRRHIDWWRTGSQDFNPRRYKCATWHLIYAPRRQSECNTPEWGLRRTLCFVLLLFLLQRYTDLAVHCISSLQRVYSILWQKWTTTLS